MKIFSEKSHAVCERPRAVGRSGQLWLSYRRGVPESLANALSVEMPRTLFVTGQIGYAVVSALLKSEHAISQPGSYPGANFAVDNGVAAGAELRESGIEASEVQTFPSGDFVSFRASRRHLKRCSRCPTGASCAAKVKLHRCSFTFVHADLMLAPAESLDQQRMDDEIAEHGFGKSANPGQTSAICGQKLSKFPPRQTARCSSPR